MVKIKFETQTFLKGENEKRKSIRIWYVWRWLHLVKTQVTKCPPETADDHETNFVRLFIWKRKKKRKTKRDWDLLFVFVFTFLSFICRRTTCVYWLGTLSAGRTTTRLGFSLLPCCFFSFAPVKMQTGVYQQAERKWHKKKMFFIFR